MIRFTLRMITTSTQPYTPFFSTASYTSHYNHHSMTKYTYKIGSIRLNCKNSEGSNVCKSWFFWSINICNSIYKYKTLLRKKINNDVYNIPVLPSVVVFGISSQYSLTKFQFTRWVSWPVYNNSPMIPETPDTMQQQFSAWSKSLLWQIVTRNSQMTEVM